MSKHTYIKHPQTGEPLMILSPFEIFYEHESKEYVVIRVRQIVLWQNTNLGAWAGLKELYGNR